MLPRGAAAGAKTLLSLAPAAAPKQGKSSDTFLPAAVALDPEPEFVHEVIQPFLVVVTVLTGRVGGPINLPAVRILAGELRGMV